MRLKDVIEYVKRKGNMIILKWNIKDEKGNVIFEREVSYTKDEEQTWKQFRKMVKFEEEAMLRHVLSQLEEIDETERWK